MRILFVNKFAFNRGGQERVVFDEMAWLRERGHETELFSTAHPDTSPSRYSEDFPSYREIGAASTASFAAASSMFWNREAYRSLARVISDFKPDVAHFHGIHRHLSPSVVQAARDAGVRTVMTLHDYWPICPGNVLLRGGTAVCSPVACGPSFTAAATNGCVQGSRLRSGLAATELAWQRATHSYEKSIDALISPSRFLRDMVRNKGFSTARFEVIPNAVPAIPPQSASTPPAKFLYVGRLSAEKGLSVLIAAAAQTGVELVIAGDGPMRDDVTRLPFVEYLGMVPPDEVMAARVRSVAAVIPSVWYENAPLAILESMACGRPVIGTTLGGSSELIRHGTDGLLVPPSDVDSLASALVRLAGDSVFAQALGASGRERALTEYSPDKHCTRLLAVYRGDRPH